MTQVIYIVIADSMLGGNGHVIEETETIELRFHCVMAGWTDNRHSIAHFTREYSVN